MHIATDSYQRNGGTVGSQTNAQAWEDWGEVDPLWAILTHHGRRGNRWDLEAFFSTGEEVIDALMAAGEELSLPEKRERALDFGCGVGRLTRPLGRYFAEAVGLDISGPMIDKARSLDPPQNVTYRLHPDMDLAQWPDAEFDAVVSLFVLQHIPDLAMMERYVCELTRVLAQGGLGLIQLPDSAPPEVAPRAWKRVAKAVHRTATTGLRRAGVPPNLLYRTTRWRPDMPMTVVSQDRVRELVESAGGAVLQTRIETESTGMRHVFYYVTRA